MAALGERYAASERERPVGGTRGGMGIAGPALAAAWYGFSLYLLWQALYGRIRADGLLYTDLLIIGLGPDMRPLSPATRKHLTGLGLRVEVLDTRNAASQFNMLATERGVDDVAAALIPIGWREGIGANYD